MLLIINKICIDALLIHIAFSSKQGFFTLKISLVCTLNKPILQLKQGFFAPETSLICNEVPSFACL